MPTIRINRAPVLTLWATVVAERLGHERDAALTLARALAGMNANSKGRALGLIEPAASAGAGTSRRRAPAPPRTVELMHRAVPVMDTPDGLRALAKGAPLDPRAVERYLCARFGRSLDAVTAAMRALAGSRPAAALAQEAWPMYERFRPQVPAGARGWGAAGELDLDAISAAAGDERRPRRVAAAPARRRAAQAARPRP
jgi:hypothetical protein